MKVKYKIVTGIAANFLEDSVQELLDQGWIPHGGASVCVTDNGRGDDLWCHQQAMIHYGEGQPICQMTE